MRRPHSLAVAAAVVVADSSTDLLLPNSKQVFLRSK